MLNCIVVEYTLFVGAEKVDTDVERKAIVCRTVCEAIVCRIVCEAIVCMAWPN